MKIIVDADACSVVKIITELAKKYQIPVILVFDFNHQIHSDYAKTIAVDQGIDSVDYKVLSLTDKDDLVVTNDYGLATLVLSKQAKCINQSGLVYDENNIDSLLVSRHLNSKLLKAKVKIKTSKKRTEKEDLKFQATLKNIIEK